MSFLRSPLKIWALAGLTAMGLLTGCGCGCGGDDVAAATPAGPAPVVSVAGPTRVVTNTLYSYSASLSSGTASAWSWLWGDASANGSGSPVPKVWYRVGSFNVKADATVNGQTVSGSTSVTAAAPLGAGGLHTCALKGDGKVACWGDNSQGQLGDGSTTNRATPTVVPNVNDAVAVAASSESHTCALIADGAAVCWGDNWTGQLGDGSTMDRSIPTLVSGLSDAVALTTGSLHTCALKSDGTVACWGYNSSSQLGDGTTTYRLTPTVVPGLSGVVSVGAGGAHTCALKGDGTVACWGRDSVDDGAITPHATPKAVAGLSDVVSLAVGDKHTCALKGDGTVACWGDDTHGQLGIDNPNSFAFTPQPTVVPGLSGVLTVAAGRFHTCALKADGSVICWGTGDSGQLGDGLATDHFTPTPTSAGAVFWK